MKIIIDKFKYKLLLNLIKNGDKDEIVNFLSKLYVYDGNFLENYLEYDSKIMYYGCSDLLKQYSKESIRYFIIIMLKFQKKFAYSNGYKMIIRDMQTCFSEKEIDEIIKEVNNDI